MFKYIMVLKSIVDSWWRQQKRHGNVAGEIVPMFFQACQIVARKTPWLLFYSDQTNLQILNLPRTERNSYTKDQVVTPCDTKWSEQLLCSLIIYKDIMTRIYVLLKLKRLLMTHLCYPNIWETEKKLTLVIMNLKKEKHWGWH